jgi:hypothetical protein
MRRSAFRDHSVGWSTLVLTLLAPALGCTGVVSRTGTPSQPTGSQPGSGSPGVNMVAGGTTGNPASVPGGTVVPSTGQQNPNGSTPTTTTAAPPPSAPGVVPLRRLSLLEYRNTIRDLLGNAMVQTDDLPVDQQAATSGFAVGAAITSAPDARLLLDKADLVSTSAASKLGTLVPCVATATTVAPAGETCARQFITQFGRKAYRRPLVDEEVTRLVALYNAQIGPDIGATFSDSIRALVMGMLQSPNFLYRRELGSSSATMDGTLVKYNSQEMASQLSYSFWATMPDDRLFQLADTDKLQTVDQIQAEVRRMITDPKAKDTYADFATQWLSLTQLPTALKDPSLNFTAQTAQSMLAETGAFVSDLFQGPKATGSLEALLTSRSTFIDGTLAKIYGVSGVTGTTLQPVTLDASQRAGILTQASFLTMHGSTDGSFPVRRGAQVYRRLFCREIELPDNVQVVAPPPALPGQTTRQRFAAHAMNACAGCHALLDPIGFAFENYDGLGAYRTTDNGQPVDASGTLPFLAAGPLPFNNAIDMVTGLAKDQQVRDCVATQWTRYILRRREGPGDLASLQQAQAAFRASSYDMRELLVAIASTDSFSHRTPATGEVLP